MITTLGFDAAGRCAFSVNDVVPPENAPAGMVMIQLEGTVDPNSVYYDHANSRMGPRVPLIPAVSTNTVSNLPPGTIAVVQGEQIPVDDGSLELEVSYAQTLVVTLMHVRYSDVVVEVPCEVQG